ncbi:MAG: hypothetical protein ACLPYO_18055 [Mycobacterium sp.]
MRTPSSSSRARTFSMSPPLRGSTSTTATLPPVLAQMALPGLKVLSRSMFLSAVRVGQPLGRVNSAPSGPLGFRSATHRETFSPSR